MKKPPLEHLKSDFPLLNNQPDLVYLDSAATSQKPQAVIDAVTSFYTNSNANIDRGIYDLSQIATELFEKTRASVSQFIGASSPGQIIFTHNTTEAINLVAYGWASKNLQRDDIIVVSQMEHHSNLVPWQRVCDRVGCRLFFLPLTDDYRLDYRAIGDLDVAKVKLIALPHASNVLGTINPLAEIAAFFKQQGAEAKLLVDAAQTAPHVPVNVQALGADFLAFSAHKMLGPSGVGVLYAKPELLEAMEPLLVGSHMISSVTEQTAVWAKSPAKFEPGTRNLEGVAGLGAAIDYLRQVGLPAVTQHDHELTAYALDLLKAQANITLFGPPDAINRLAIFSFAVAGAHPHDVAEILNRASIAVRAGHHCAQPLMRYLGVAGTVRASFYLYNNQADVDALISGLEQVKQVLRI